MASPVHTKLYKGAWNLSANNSETVAHKDLRLGQISLHISLLIITFHFLSLFHWMVSNLFIFVAWQWKRSVITVCGEFNRQKFLLECRIHFARGHAYRSWSWGKSPALALKKPSREDQKPVSIFFSFNNTPWPCKYRSLRTYYEKKNSKRCVTSACLQIWPTGS